MIDTVFSFKFFLSLGFIFYASVFCLSCMGGGQASGALPVEYDESWIDLVFTEVRRLVDKTENADEVADAFQVFLGPKRRAASYPQERYLSRLYEYFHCSVGVHVAATLYIKRLIKEYGKNIFNPISFHRMFLVSLVVAVKFWSDKFYDNEYYARVGGIPNLELNNLEVVFLNLIHFDLVISREASESFVIGLLMQP